LDALEYELVEEGDFPNLKQKEYGKIILTARKLATPLIWASFITGKTPEEAGIIDTAKWDSRFVQKLKKFLFNIGLSRLISGKGKYLERLGFRKVAYSKADLNVSTIFDLVEKSFAISVPSYNEMPMHREIGRELWEAIGNRELEKRVEEKAWRFFNQKKNKLFEILDGDWQLLMTHFFVTDVLQHMWWYREDYIRDLYGKMDKLVGEIKGKVNDKNTLVLVISDHGQKKGLHTPYGFYSCNQVLELKNPKMTDFSKIIEGKLGLPSKEDLEKVKEHLKALGYI
jgi:predicted AlkP superfamily phosphohydrolase/phosphomutase